MATKRRPSLAYDSALQKPQRLPALPRIRLEHVADLTPRQPKGFLQLMRDRLRAVYPDGSSSAPFVYDAVDRAALDAVVMVLHFVKQGQRHVYLRSAMRPPLVRRHRSKRPPAEGRLSDGGLWELPAGLIEPSETGRQGALRCAQREIQEEVGFDVKLGQLRRLGPALYPAPAVIPEQHVFLEAEVDPRTQGAPSLDGSALEAHGKVIAVQLAAALKWCRQGKIRDEKTELGLRRLQERYP